jgi:uncharacterized membrane protein
MHKLILRLTRSLSTVGLVVGTLFFAASLTPSLLPRDFLLQGLLSGSSFAAGYLFGIAADLLWRYLQLPVASAQARIVLMTVALVASALVIVLSLRQASVWQDSIRLLMELEPV